MTTHTHEPTYVCRARPRPHCPHIASARGNSDGARRRRRLEARHARVLKQYAFCNLQDDARLRLRARKQRNVTAGQIEQHHNHAHCKARRLALLAARQHGTNARVILGPAHLPPDAQPVRCPGRAENARRHQLDDEPDQLQLEVGRPRHQVLDVLADLPDRLEAVDGVARANRRVCHHVDHLARRRRQHVGRAQLARPPARMCTHRRIVDGPQVAPRRRLGRIRAHRRAEPRQHAAIVCKNVHWCGDLARLPCFYTSTSQRATTSGLRMSSAAAAGCSVSSQPRNGLRSCDSSFSIAQNSSTRSVT